MSPRRLHPESTTLGEPLGASPARCESTGDTSFVWPPRPLPADGPSGSQNHRESVASTRSHVTVRPGFADDVPTEALDPAWNQIERTWLGLTGEPLAARLRAVAWESEAFCERCGHTIEERAATAHGRVACPHCATAKPVPWARFVRLGAYAPPLDAIIREVKFTAFRTLGTELGTMLGRRLRDAVDEAVKRGELSAGVRLVIVPVPTSFRRRMARGIDHTLVIARAAAKKAGGSLWTPLGRRHRPSQVSLAASHRAENVKGTMHASWATRLLGRLGWSAAHWLDRHATVLVLVDDVATTGATLREASRAVGEVVRRRSSGGAAGRQSLSEPRLWFWAATVAVTPRKGGTP